MLHNLVFIQNVKQSGFVILSGGEINELMDQKEAAGTLKERKGESERKMRQWRELL